MGFSVFVDADLRPYANQWAFLASIQPMAAFDIEPTILRAPGGVHPLDVTFIDDEDLATPWKRERTATGKLAGANAKIADRDAGQPDLLRQISTDGKFARRSRPEGERQGWRE